MEAKCPYCEKVDEIEMDGQEEDGNYEHECRHCLKNFAYTISVVVYCDTSRADCLNGGEHKWVPVKHYPAIWPDRKRCSDCGYEEKGERI